MAGPSTEMSAKIPAAWFTLGNFDSFEAIMDKSRRNKGLTASTTRHDTQWPSQAIVKSRKALR